MNFQIILLVMASQVGALVEHKPASNEHQMRHNRIDKSRNDAIISMDEHYQRPYFDTNDAAISPNTTIVRGENAYLVCVVRNLGNNSISWIRHNDINLLSVGKFVYTQDPRYQIFHNSHNDTWTLKIRRVRTEDSGLYECQIGIATSQPIGRMIYLKVIEPQLWISQGHEMFIGVGSNLNLTCYIRQPSQQQRQPSLDDDERRRSALRWLHNDQEVNHHSPRGVFISVTQQDEDSISHLIIRNLTQSDAGVYKCLVSKEVYASIAVHIESDQAMETKVSNIAHAVKSEVTFVTMMIMASLRLSYQINFLRLSTISFHKHQVASML